MRSVSFAMLIGPLAFVISCASMPGDVSYSESKTDGVKELSVDPGWLKGAYVKLGVYKTSKMDKDKATIVVLSNNTIGFDDSLLINIDGEKTAFKSFDKISLMEKDIADKIWFKKRYDVNLSFLQKMLSGKDVWIKLTGQNGTYAEGEFKDEPMSARRGVAKFLLQVNSKGEILSKSPQK